MLVAFEAVAARAEHEDVPEPDGHDRDTRFDPARSAHGDGLASPLATVRARRLVETSAPERGAGFDPGRTGSSCAT